MVISHPAEPAEAGKASDDLCTDGTDPEIPLYEDNAYAWYLGVSVCVCVCLSVLTEMIRRYLSMRIMLVPGGKCV